MDDRVNGKGGPRTPPPVSVSEGFGRSLDDNVPIDGSASHVRRVHDSASAPLDEPAATPRQLALGAAPFVAAYELMFEMVEMLLSRTGRVRQELVGFEFQRGVPMPARAVWVEQSAGLQRLMEEMLDRWPVVAHIFQGWSSPEPGSFDHHARCEVVVIALYTVDDACMATCKVIRNNLHREDGSRRSSAEAITLEQGRLRPIRGMPDATDKT